MLLTVVMLFSSAVGIFIFICFVGHSGYTISPCQATQVCSIVGV